MAKNKIIFGNITLIDLTGDTATAADVAAGATFHLNSGDIAVGLLADGNLDSYGDPTTPRVGMAIVNTAII